GRLVLEEPGAVEDFEMRREQGEGGVELGGAVLGGQAEQAETMRQGAVEELAFGQGAGRNRGFVGREQVQVDLMATRLGQGSGQLQAKVALAFQCKHSTSQANRPASISRR